VGTYPGVVGVDLQDLMFRELTVLGARAYTPEDIRAAITLLERGGIDATRFITGVMPLEDGAAAVQRLRDGEAIKVLLEGPSA